MGWGWGEAFGRGDSSRERLLWTCPAARAAWLPRPQASASSAPSCRRGKAGWPLAACRLSPVALEAPRSSSPRRCLLRAGGSQVQGPPLVSSPGVASVPSPTPPQRQAPSRRQKVFLLSRFWDKCLSRSALLRPPGTALMHAGHGDSSRLLHSATRLRPRPGVCASTAAQEEGTYRQEKQKNCPRRKGSSGGRIYLASSSSSAATSVFRESTRRTCGVCCSCS